jgi:hypothetical protein
LLPHHAYTLEPLKPRDAATMDSARNPAPMRDESPGSADSSILKKLNCHRPTERRCRSTNNGAA